MNSSGPSAFATNTPRTQRGKPLAKSFIFGYVACTHSPKGINSPKKSCPLTMRNCVALLVLTNKRAIAHATCRTAHGNRRCVLRMSTRYCSERTLAHVLARPATYWFAVSPSARDWEEYLRFAGLSLLHFVALNFALNCLITTFRMADSWSVCTVNCLQPKPGNQVSEDSQHS